MSKARIAWRYRRVLWKYRKPLWSVWKHRYEALAVAGAGLGFVVPAVIGRAMAARYCGARPTSRKRAHEHTAS